MKTKRPILAILALLAVAIAFCGCKELLGALAESYTIPSEKLEGVWERYKMEANENGSWRGVDQGNHYISFDTESETGQSSDFGKFTYFLQAREVRFNPQNMYEVAPPRNLMWVNEQNPWELAWSFERNGVKYREYLKRINPDGKRPLGGISKEQMERIREVGARGSKRKQRRPPLKID